MITFSMNLIFCCIHVLKAVLIYYFGFLNGLLFFRFVNRVIFYCNCLPVSWLYPGSQSFFSVSQYVSYSVFGQTPVSFEDSQNKLDRKPGFFHVFLYSSARGEWS